MLRILAKFREFWRIFVNFFSPPDRWPEPLTPALVIKNDVRQQSITPSNYYYCYHYDDDDYYYYYYDYDYDYDYDYYYYYYYYYYYCYYYCYYSVLQRFMACYKNHHHYCCCCCF